MPADNAGNFWTEVPTQQILSNDTIAGGQEEVDRHTKTSMSWTGRMRQSRLSHMQAAKRECQAETSSIRLVWHDQSVSSK